MNGVYWDKVCPCMLRHVPGNYQACTVDVHRRGARELVRKPRPLAVNNVALLDPLRSVQFSSVQFSSVQASACAVARVVRSYKRRPPVCGCMDVWWAV